MSSDNHSHLEQSGASDESLQQVHSQLSTAKADSSPAGYRFQLVLLGLMCCMIYAGSVYLAHYSSRFDGAIYNENQKPGGAVAAPVQVSPAQLGKVVFNANCMACHQATGNGIPGIYPPLAGSEWVLNAEHEKHIIKIVLHGLSGPITVKGNTYNNVMTPFGSVLRDEQIANVLTYIRSEWGNNAPPITADQVKAIRAEFGTRGPWTVDELAKAP